jgi:23S rRNA (cytidine1920-2'-O)/16S rRNA (cytidine1409-2'-O)-methyltransferase
MERTNAMHVNLPELLDLVVIDVAWTKQRHILGPARAMLKPGGAIVSLVKPHYEADPALLVGGVLPQSELPGVKSAVFSDIQSLGLDIRQDTLSPIEGGKGNVELLVLLRAS